MNEKKKRNRKVRFAYGTENKILSKIEIERQNEENRKNLIKYVQFLRFKENYSLREIGRILNCSHQTVANILEDETIYGATVSKKLMLSLNPELIKSINKIMSKN